MTVADRSRMYPWTSEPYQVLELGEWLVDNDICTTARELQRYYEKPWKWDAEWKAKQAADEGKPCPNLANSTECLCPYCEEHEDDKPEPMDADNKD